MSNRQQLSAAVLVLSGVLASCAQEQPPINRVQPDYFDKSFFVGADYLDAKDDPEFYSRGTLVDVGYGAGQDGLFTSTYAQPLTRVKWTITQDMLIARLSYERIEHSDHKGLGKATNDGIVVAAYRIDSQFDVKRSYNPSTGEQTNVIEENTIDRPWSQRQYIRVDWSRNLSTDGYDYDTLSQIGMYGGISYEPLAYYINDPTSDDAPHFDLENGYLDITNKAFAKPLEIDLSVWGAGMMPACFVDADVSGGTAPTSGCQPVEITIRQSFRKVVDTDYEPEDWDGDKFAAFGAFTTERMGYARNYGMTDTQWHRFIERHNIWERSHAYKDPTAMTGATECYTPATTPAGINPHRDENNDGTEDECASVGNGSRCDTFKQRCTLPFRSRKEKPIVWYYSSGSNPEFFEASRMATHDWDAAMRTAVNTARYTECKKTNGSDCASKYPVITGGQEENDDLIFLSREVDDCRRAGKPNCEQLADTLGSTRKYSAAVISMAKQPEMVLLCHSPVENNDPAACGGPRLPEGLTAFDCYRGAIEGTKDVVATCAKALTVRNGDLRFNQVNSITSPQTPSPWGIMVDAKDPLTGETVQGSVNVWTHVNNLWSQGVVDMARYINHELATEDVTEGTYVRDWASAASNAVKGMSPKIDAAHKKQMLASMFGREAEQMDVEAFKKTPAFAATKKWVNKMGKVSADARAVSSTRAIYETRRKHALNTPTEAALNTVMMQSLAGSAGQLNTSALLELTSPLRGGNPNLRRDMARARELALAERGACIMNEAPAPLALANLADILQQKFGNFDPTQSKQDQLARGEKMRVYMANRVHYAVLTHEMGHSIGLRHNFVSSADPLNYRPQYWQLRTDNGTATEACTTFDPTGACVGPRYQDPITDNEKNNLLPMFMQSSTMDYAGEATQDMIGLGSYDFAAARMFYGGAAAVFADDSFKVGTDRAAGMLSKLDSFGGILGIRYSLGDGQGGTNDIHYSQLQANYELIRDCENVTASNFKPEMWNEAVDGKWNPVLDSYLVSVGGNASRCHSQPVDYVAWSKLVQDDPELGPTNDKDGRVRFPYGFATDHWADLGNLSVYRHDNGADPYELFDFLITQQEVNHIFDDYRRNRRTFSVRTAADRQLTRYNEKIRDAAKGLGLIATGYRDFAVAEGYDPDTLWPYVANAFFGENYLASGIGFDHFASIMARPQSGPHYMGAQYGKQVLRSNDDSAGNAPDPIMNIPNGATGYFGNVVPGGRPVENALGRVYGDYNSSYTMNAGSYYSKAYTAMLMTESVDNFISSSRRDFIDARYRAVSLGDVFPDGYRRWLANNLTGDDLLKGPRVAATGNTPTVETGTLYPTNALGYTSWWRPTPASCFPKSGSLECDTVPATSIAVDPEIGWEQQKFLIAYTLQYLPENQQQTWLNQLGIWELGADSNPDFTNRIELHLPNGKTYIAKTFGSEIILGKKVQKGIGARILEWGNELMALAYTTANGPDLDGDMKPDWYLPTFGTNGQPLVKYDPSIAPIAASGGIQTNGRPGCNAQSNTDCTCSSNKACLELQSYSEVPFFMRQAMRDYGLAEPSMKGIY